MTDLVNKRFQVVAGFAMLPEDSKVMYAGPHYYGKLTYEAAVQVQAIAAKHKEAIEKAMAPMVEELLDIGIAQASVVEGSRKGNPNG